MDQMNLWWIRITSTQKFLKNNSKNKRYNWMWRILHADQGKKKKGTCWLFTKDHSDEQEDFYWYWTRKNTLSAYEISKKVIHLLRHSQQVHRKEDGAVHCWRTKEIFRMEEPKGDSSIALMIQEQLFISELFKDIQDVTLLILSLQDNVVIQSGFFQHIYHVGCAFNLHSLINSGLIPGGQNSSKRQTVFILRIITRDKSH